MDKVTFLTNFGKIEKKEKRYSLYNACLNCLTPEETIRVLDTDFSQDILTRFLISRKVQLDLKKEFTKTHEEIIEIIFEKIKHLSTYHRKQAAAKFLTEIYDFLPSEYQKTVIDYQFNSPYAYDRKRAYILLEKCYDAQWTEKLFEHLKKYPDNYPLALIINNCSPEFLFKNFEFLNKYFEDEDVYYDWALLKIRTKFYGKIYKIKPGYVKKLLSKDYISFMYILREAHAKADPNLALKAYNKNPRPSLFRLFSDLKLWDVLVKISKKTENEIL